MEPIISQWLIYALSIVNILVAIIAFIVLITLIALFLTCIQDELKNKRKTKEIKVIQVVYR